MISRLCRWFVYYYFIKLVSYRNCTDWIFIHKDEFIIQSLFYFILLYLAGQFFPLEAIAIPISLSIAIIIIAFIALYCTRKRKTTPEDTNPFTVQRKVFSHSYDFDSDSDNESMFQSRDGSPTSSRPSSGRPSPTKPLPRQSTVPLLPQRQRQEAFRKQRQLSLQLNLTNVEFSVKNINVMRKDQTDLIGTLRPELYRQETKEKQGKPKGERPSCGRLVFSLFYDYATETLNVHIERAVGLPAKDFSGTSDPYVKIYLCPDRKRKYQTKVHRKNCDPIFDERFAFQIPYNDLESKTLKFTVYDFDRFSRHDLIGEVNITSIVTTRDLSKETQYVEDIVKGTSQVRKAVPASVSRVPVIKTFEVPCDMSWCERIRNA